MQWAQPDSDNKTRQKLTCLRVGAFFAAAASLYELSTTSDVV